MQNFKSISNIISTYWGFDISPPHSTCPNYLPE
jgi:hypothetical protein